jgi:hypothetical protein
MAYRSKLTANFLRHYRKLPPDVRARARAAYQRWRENPNHPGLHFKRIAATANVYSVRVDAAHRAVGMLAGDIVTWDFIGTHDAYMLYLESL